MSVDSVRRSAQKIARPVAQTAAKATAAAAKKVADVRRDVARGHSAKSSFEPHKKPPVDLQGRQPPRATQRTSGGTNDDSIGTNDDSIGTNDDSIGTNDDSIGGVGQLSSGEQQQRNQAVKHGETPGYLDGNKGRNNFHGEKQKKLEDRIARSGASAADQKALVAISRSNKQVANELDSVLRHSGKLSKTDREDVLHKFALDPKGDTGKVLAHVMASDSWKNADAATKSEMAQVMVHAGPLGLKSFGSIVERHPDALTQKASDGSTTLDQLKTLATADMASKLGDASHARPRVLDGTLQAIAYPNAIDQGRTAPTCTVTSMEYELARDRPAEYARLMAGLSTGDGKVAMAGGGELSLQREYLDPTATDGRSMSDVIFQSAAMEYGNGKANFNARTGISTGPNGDTYAGLYPKQQVNMLEQLFNTKYTAVNLDTPAKQDEVVNELRSFDPQKARRAVVMDINLGNHNHAVTFDGIKGDRVFFRDPYGRRASMSIDEFKKDVCTVHVPDSVAQNARAKDAVLAKVSEAVNPFTHWFGGMVPL